MEAKVQLHAFCNSTVDEGKESASRPAALSPVPTGQHRWVSSRVWTLWRAISALPGTGPRSFSTQSLQTTDNATPTRQIHNNKHNNNNIRTSGGPGSSCGLRTDNPEPFRGFPQFLQATYWKVPRIRS
jgi:hypothetical protein